MTSTAARWITSAALAAAGVLHLQAAADHRQLRLAFAFFSLLGAAQLLAAALASARRPPSAPALLLLTLAPSLVWVVSRTSGMPAWSGHGGVEAVGVRDLAAVGLQLLVASLVLVPLAVRTPRVAVGTMALASALVLGVVGTPAHGTAEPRTPVPVSVRAETPTGRLVEMPTPVAPQEPAGHHHGPSSGSDHGH